MQLGNLTALDDVIKDAGTVSGFTLMLSIHHMLQGSNHKLMVTYQVQRRNSISLFSLAGYYFSDENSS